MNRIESDQSNVSPDFADQISTLAESVVNDSPAAASVLFTLAGCMKAGTEAMLHIHVRMFAREMLDTIKKMKEDEGK